MLEIIPVARTCQKRRAPTSAGYGAAVKDAFDDPRGVEDGSSLQLWPNVGGASCTVYQYVVQAGSQLRSQEPNSKLRVDPRLDHTSATMGSVGNQGNILLKEIPYKVTPLPHTHGLAS